MSGLLIIGLLIFFSGLIAYLGDRIGMKAGKKRISIFGLRPRYSSIIITVLTGVVIAGLSISILLMTYSGLREALLNINEVLQRLENLNQQLTLKDQELTDMKQEIDNKVQELAALQEQRNDLRDKLASTQAEFEQVKDNLEQARQEIDTLESNRQELEKRISNLQNQREELEKEIDRLNDQIAQLNQDYQQVKELASQYQAGMMYYMGEDIVYQRGDIIYSDIIKGGQSEEKTITALNDFLSKANEEAKKRQIQVDEKSGMALWLKTEDIMNAARVLYNMEEGKKAIVSLVARVNVPRNDKLYASFLLNKNFVVYEKGALIAARTIDADQEASAIENSLEQLLDTVNSDAIKKGILPDTRGQVGSLDFSRFYDILNQIKGMKGKVEVRVYAAEAIWREDRLSDNMEFKIELINGVGSNDNNTGD